MMTKIHGIGLGILGTITFISKTSLYLHKQTTRSLAEGLIVSSSTASLFYLLSIAILLKSANRQSVSDI